MWFLWLQGWQSAPALVKECFKSWEMCNHEFDVIFVDIQNLRELVEIEIPDKIFNQLSPQLQSDVIRLALLNAYGGVWADATTFCTKPLKGWLPGYFDSGFFAFRLIGHKNLIICSWFLVSLKGHKVIDKWHSEFNEYWCALKYPQMGFLRSLVFRILRRFFNSSVDMTTYWHANFVHKVLKIYPYFIVMYIFTSINKNDGEFNKFWRETNIYNCKKIIKLRENILSINSR
ncbi:MAG: hypothetical protein COA52_04060 [Hyphomicrobiales bacterium]|nr:MAG: hypothetical protein COA52_04060 [Hyphomicrobiales bacterium]